MGNLQKTLMIEIEIVKQTVLIYIRDCLLFLFGVEKCRKIKKFGERFFFTNINICATIINVFNCKSNFKIISNEMNKVLLFY